MFLGGGALGSKVGIWLVEFGQKRVGGLYGKGKRVLKIILLCLLHKTCKEHVFFSLYNEL